MTTLTREQIEEYKEWLSKEPPAIRGFTGRLICDMALSSLDLLAERERLVGALELAAKRLDVIAGEIKEYGVCTRRSVNVYGFSTEARAAAIDSAMVQK